MESQLKVVVATASALREGRISLSHDMELVRAALLYADRIELVSPLVTLLVTAIKAPGWERKLPSVGLTGLIDRHSRFFTPNRATMAKAEQFDRWLHSRDLFLRNSRTEPGQISRSTIRMIDVVREFIQESPQKSPKELLTLAGAGDLLPTMRAGIVRVSFGDLDGPRGGRDTQRSYEESLQRRLKDPMSRLLFDDEIAGLVEGMVTRGLLRPHPLAEARADQASVGSRLITRLPALTRPPIDELLAMRGDLEAPLVNYRAAVVRMAKQLAHHSYSREFLAEIEALWVSDVAPAISRFREEMADHGLARRRRVT